MPLLAEYAITPDVFDAASHSTDEVCGLHLRTIGQVMMEEGLVRDLRAGEWRALLTNHGRPWHRLAKKLVERLFTQGRLVAFPIALPTVPADDKEWCAEALAGHRWRPMTGGPNRNWARKGRVSARAPRRASRSTFAGEVVGAAQSLRPTGSKAHRLRRTSGSDPPLREFTPIHRSSLASRTRQIPGVRETPCPRWAPRARARHRDPPRGVRRSTPRPELPEFPKRVP